MSILFLQSCSRDRYITHFYCLAVEAGFYSDVVECLTLDPAAQVRFPPRAVRIFLHPVTIISLWKRELISLFVFLVSRDYYVALPRDITDLSAVCGCVFS